jgi:ferric-dicitrate binding protein FerR (iron transport regulator)
MEKCVNAHGKQTRLRAERAAEWLNRLETAGAQEKTEFLRWLKESPQNVREFLIAGVLDDALRGIDSERKYDVHALLTRPPSVTPINTRSSPPTRPIPTEAS